MGIENEGDFIAGARRRKSHFEQGVLCKRTRFCGGSQVYGTILRGVQPHGDDSFEVSLRSKDDDGDVSSAIKIFCNELIEQQVRHDLQNRFGKLREIIVAHAFSPLERQ